MSDGARDRKQPDRTPGPPPAPPPAVVPPATPACDLCGTPMLEHHCKLVCPACGYTRDCSDP